MNGITTQSPLREKVRMRGDLFFTLTSVLSRRRLCRNALFTYRSTQISPGPSFSKRGSASDP